jgi:hypothetical protein
MRTLPYRSVCFLLGVLSVEVLIGCQSRPKAPALVNDPVFQSDEGFRLLVPEGWIMTARGNVPSGPLDKECLLVQYLSADADPKASLDVSRVDLPEDANLAEYLSRPAYSASNWKASGKPESLEVGGRTGLRYRFTARISGAEMIREATVFRQERRVYLFSLLYSPRDNAALEQARRAIHSLVWTK